jgi:acyl-coenzyme A synthetase/AMP-(fatty) acid ligase
MPAIPLIRHDNGAAAFALRSGNLIGVNQFLWDVSRLAALLPDRQHIINLCADRYNFVVGFTAALLRQQINLLPPNYTPGLIDQLAQRYPDVYCLTDAASAHDTLETLFYPQQVAPDSGTRTVPTVPAAQIAAIVFTSGSTGQPMPHAKSWGGLVKSALAAADRLGVRAHPGMTILGTVPPQHMYGLESTALIAMHSGLTIHAGRPFYPADIRAQLEALPRPRGLVTTPVHLRALLAEDGALPALDFLLCATAPLSPQLAAEAEARFGTALYEIYGFTEAGQVATRRTVETPEWQTFSDIKLRQVDGAVWVCGGHVEAEVAPSDVIELRGPETFLLHGRTADLVNIAGKRTSLSNLNYHLNAIDGVLDGVFVMPAEEDRGVTRLMAFVVAPGISSEALTSALRQRIDAAFLPRPLCFVDALPRNATGKLPREALSRLLSQVAGKAGQC